jgi:N6-L-threonylcarbamoyladenine synthase
MKILAIDTSCDETAAAVTDGTKILSNVIWSQASAHAKFGGVMPSLAQRMHEERIDFVINKALITSRYSLSTIDAIAITVGPGLSIALGVGIDRAKKLAIKYNKKIIAVNHLEGHLLSCLAEPKTENFKFQISNFKLPALGLVVSGGNTLLVKINKIGSYETLAQTSDDALGEAFDKAARMLGLGYPGGAILEKMAKFGTLGKFKLPIPLLGQEDRMIFSYSGLKTSMMRKVAEVKLKNGELSKQDVYDLAASFQDVALTHLIRVCSHVISNFQFPISNLLVGGGVSANIELRKRLRKIGKKYGIRVFFPYSKKLTGDNAAMIGIAASFKYDRNEFTEVDKIDRSPNLKI